MVEYIDRLKAAVEYIEDNLCQDLKVSYVARQIGYSPYHFHRVFRASMGESVAEYIRKRRLAKASQRLLNSDMPVSAIAMEAMFDSQESFTRAFKKMYRVTPSRYRKNQHTFQIIESKTFSTEWLEHLSGGVTMEPCIKTRDGELVIGMGGSFALGDHKKITQLWQEFDQYRSRIENVVHGYSLGLCLDEHPDIERKEGSNFIYIAALPVSSIDVVPEGMVKVEIPASKYAVFTHSGPINKISQTVNYIWGTWVPRNSELLKKGPDLELYDHRFDSVSLDGEVDIYVPLA